MYLQTRPTYSKWSIDPCLPDDFVIDSLQAVSPIVRKEGLDRLTPLFMEEVVRCLAELGQEDEFKRWAGVTIMLCRVGNRELAEELERILENPEKNCSTWGRRKRLKEGTDGPHYASQNLTAQRFDIQNYNENAETSMT